MNLIKQIVKESLLNEVGNASAQPYKWRSIDGYNNTQISYGFKTKGGSKLTIVVSFHLLDPSQLRDLFTNVDYKKQISKQERLFYTENPYYYWDTEFSVTEYKGKDLDWGTDKSMTISASDYKTDKNEIFRIMSTIAQIVKDFIGKNKVRGFAFRPASDKRGAMFVRYFQQQLPNPKILQLQDPVDGGLPAPTIVTINDKISYTGGDDYYDSEDETSFRDKIKTKFNR
jgi:hypothetical protein